jgi:hypothetical protein
VTLRLMLAYHFGGIFFQIAKLTNYTEILVLGLLSIFFVPLKTNFMFVNTKSDCR